MKGGLQHDFSRCVVLDVHGGGLGVLFDTFILNARSMNA